MEFNKKLIQLRNKHNHTTLDLAEKLNVSPQTIEDIEKGNISPDIMLLKKISKIYNISVDKLIDDEIDEEVKVSEERNSEEPTTDTIKSPDRKKTIYVGVIMALAITFVILGIIFIDSFSNDEQNEVGIKDNEIVDIPKDTTVVSNRLSAGRNFSLGLNDDGTVYGSGENDFGQLDVSSWRDIVSIAAGGYHSVGLTKDGEVLSIGYNSTGQTNTNSWKDVTKIAAGRYHTLGLLNDGTVVCTGENKYGQCETSGWSNVVEVSAAKYNSYGLLEDGTVVSTKSNEYGQANVSSWSDVKSISAGTYHFVGLKNDGTVLCTGGQDDTACDVSDWNGVISVDAGGYHTLAITNDQTVLATGNNAKHQLDTSKWKDVVEVSGGRQHSLALTIDGVILAIGDNSYKQLDVRKGQIVETVVKDPVENTADTSDGYNEDIVEFLGEKYTLNTKLPKVDDMKFSPNPYDYTCEGIDYKKYKCIYQILDEENNVYIHQIKDYNLIWMLKMESLNDPDYDGVIKNTLRVATITNPYNTTKDELEISEWKVLDEFDVTDYEDEIFLHNAQITVDNTSGRISSNLSDTYSRMDISEFPTGADIDYSMGIDEGMFNGSGSVDDYVSLWGARDSYITREYEPGKSFYVVIRYYGTDPWGDSRYDEDPVVNAQFTRKTAKLGIRNHSISWSNGSHIDKEFMFNWNQEWMHDKNDNSFDIRVEDSASGEIIVEQQNVILGIVETQRGENYLVDYSDLLFGNEKLLSTNSDEFKLKIYVTANGKGDYTRSDTLEYRFTIHRSEIE